MTDEATLCIAMERLFQHGVPRSRFKGSASVRLTATDTDATDEFDFSQSSASAADSSQVQDTALIWDDLPLSPGPGFSPIISIQHGYGSILLDKHNVDEYFLDDEGEWMQDGSGDWIWRASEPMMHFDFDAEDAHEQSVGSDMEFPSDSSEGLLTPSSQSLSSPNVIDRQSSAETVGPDQCEVKSQDCGAEFIVPSTPDYTPLLYQLDNTSSNPTTQEPSSNPIARHQRLHSEPAYLDYPINYYKDPYSDLDSNSDILDDCDEDVPEILSGSPFALSPDEILSGDDQFVNETFTAGTLPYPQSMEGFIMGWGDEETRLLDLDI
ncbi:hypothetical protein PILCRDRAFT_207948 [Piloderma croceum F 1598]|uniref:Uncharacterized protein n=1 Tax=Piloderma croceum (strain F 1598) TaxID=765440 RepID=A0A0C3FXJ2_PILCF|nr:hypothetical protein PILCRDRAFT_207948 [Piloderma croceum F 1598]